VGKSTATVERKPAGAFAPASARQLPVQLRVVALDGAARKQTDDSQEVICNAQRMQTFCVQLHLAAIGCGYKMDSLLKEYLCEPGWCVPIRTVRSRRGGPPQGRPLRHVLRERAFVELALQIGPGAKGAVDDGTALRLQQWALRLPGFIHEDDKKAILFKVTPCAADTNMSAAVVPRLRQTDVRHSLLRSSTSLSPQDHAIHLAA
jgi:hypothetical protein